MRQSAEILSIVKHFIGQVPRDKCAVYGDSIYRAVSRAAGLYPATDGYYSELAPRACIPSQFAQPSSSVSGQLDPGKFSLSDLVNMSATGRYLRVAIFHPFAIDAYCALLDHAKGVGRAGDETCLL